LLENTRNAITRLPMDRLGRNLGSRIPSCSQYWKCYNSCYDGNDWDDSWVVASKQHLCCKTVSLVLVVTANRTVNVLVLWGVEIKKQNIHNFAETWMTVPLWYEKIKSGRKTANINNRTVNVLVLWGVEIKKNIHNFAETWMTVPLWYEKIKSGRKTLVVLLLLRPIVQ